MNRSVWPWMAVWTVLSIPLSAVVAGNTPEIVTSRTEFAIPFRYDEAELRRQQVQLVHLFLSRDSGQTWQEIKSLTPGQANFRFLAPHEGTYCFSVAVSGEDRQPRPDPRSQSPGLQVIVDRTPPALQLQLRPLGSDRVELSWEARDANLLIESLELEFRNSPENPWSKVFVKQESAGSTSWRIRPGQQPEVRGRVADRAGNIGEQTARLSGQALGESPLLATTGATGNIPVGQAVQSQSSNGQPISRVATSTQGKGLQVRPVGGDAPHDVILPTISPGSSRAEGSAKTPKESDEASRSSAASANSAMNLPTFSGQQGEQESSLQTVSGEVPPAPPMRDRPAPTFPSIPAPAPAPVLAAPGTFSGEPAGPVKEIRRGSQVRYLNARDFQMEYQVTGVGPSGIGMVELFITQDNGAEWWRYGIDPDMVSPMKVQVPEDGPYGFYFRIHSGVGNAEPPPQPGQQPQIQVVVDSRPPRVKLKRVYQGHGQQSQQLTVEWLYEDENPGEQPVSLYVSSHQHGPWQPLATGLPNTGSYTTPLPHNAAHRIFVKLLGSDAAGNMTEVISETPILIDLAKPAARILMIDAVR